MKVGIKGDIVTNEYKKFYDYYGYECTCPADIENAINKTKDKLIIEINSSGGMLMAGIEIYSMIQNCNKNCEIHITGMAGSSASIIAMAGYSKISSAGVLMIHNTSTAFCEGNKNDLMKKAKVLDAHDKAIVQAYINKTNLSEEVLLDYMNAETYFNAKEAIRLGFVDEILGQEKFQNSVNASNSNLRITQLEIEHATQELNNKKEHEKRKNKLRLLEMECKQ